MKPLKEPMLPKEFTKAVLKLVRQHAGVDPEAYAGRCEELMEEMLIALGYERGISVMRSHERY